VREGQPCKRNADSKKDTGLKKGEKHTSQIIILSQKVFLEIEQRIYRAVPVGRQGGELADGRKLGLAASFRGGLSGA